MFRFIAILRHARNITMNYHGEWQWCMSHARSVGKWVALNFSKEK